MFDPTTEDKLLRFFSTGSEEELHNYKWIAVPRIESVDRHTLFGKIGDDSVRNKLEEMLSTSCHPLTLGQRCADWFLLKMCVTGTLAGKIAALVDRDGSEVIVASDEKKINMLQMCFTSWFKRHQASNNMKVGSENEEPTLTKLRTKHFI